MDKLQRALSGKEQNDEESGIITQVKLPINFFYPLPCDAQDYDLSQDGLYCNKFNIVNACDPCWKTDVDFVVMDESTLSWSTRVKGFAICFVIGILLSFLGSFALFLSKGLTVFAIFYTLGNVTSLLSTCFLMGPFKQIKKMFASTRIVTTIIVFASMALTLFAALHLHKAGLALLFIIIQSLAMTWYSLSYIPYARDFVKKSLESCVT